MAFNYLNNDDFFENMNKLWEKRKIGARPISEEDLKKQVRLVEIIDVKGK